MTEIRRKVPKVREVRGVLRRVIRFQTETIIWLFYDFRTERKTWWIAWGGCRARVTRFSTFKMFYSFYSLKYFQYIFRSSSSVVCRRTAGNRTVGAIDETVPFSKRLERVRGHSWTFSFSGSAARAHTPYALVRVRQSFVRTTADIRTQYNATQQQQSCTVTPCQYYTTVCFTILMQ